MASEAGKPAVVLLSGGLDSATTLAVARKEGFACHAMTFDYGQRHRLELRAAKKLAKALGAASHRVVRLNLTAKAGFGHSALTDDMDVPKNRIIPPAESNPQSPFAPRQARGYGGQVRNLPGVASAKPGPKSSIPPTYVPARNTIFLSIALAYAEGIGAFDVFIGVNAIDYSGYPDCRPEFIVAFENLANLATAAAVEGRGRYTIHAPLIGMTKAQIITTGLSLGVDYALTHSCYDPAPDGLACGRCDSCHLRLAGFAAAGVCDPLRYRPQP